MESRWTTPRPDGYCLSCLLREGLGESGEAKPETAGQRFGNYELLEKIGQGGMGVVYRARQINLDRIVAVKLLPFSQFTSEEAVQRFQAEASAAAGLQHPNIVAIHEVGSHEGQHYFSMDFIEGRTLAEVVREKPLPAKRAADLPEDHCRGGPLRPRARHPAPRPQALQCSD